jgi:hypothetical protein
VKLRLLPILAAVTSVAFAQPRPLDGNPGNVFVTGQEVVVRISATEVQPAMASSAANNGALGSKPATASRVDRRTKLAARHAVFMVLVSRA